MALRLFMIATSLVFVWGCDIGGIIEVTADLPCPLPLPVITDTTATGTFNGLCPFKFCTEAGVCEVILPGHLPDWFVQHT